MTTGYDYPGDWRSPCAGSDRQFYGFDAKRWLCVRANRDHFVNALLSQLRQNERERIFAAQSRLAFRLTSLPKLFRKIQVGF